MEDKQKICRLLFEALKATRNQSDLREIVYSRENDDREAVTLVYKRGKMVVNVSMDSGIAMIKDILRAL